MIRWRKRRRPKPSSPAGSAAGMPMRPTPTGPLPVGSAPPVGCLFYDCHTGRHLAYVGMLDARALVLDVLEEGDDAAIVTRADLGRRYIAFEARMMEAVER